MGHAIEYVSYKTSKSKESIMLEINEYVTYNSDNRSGLYERMEWFDNKCFNTSEDAMKYIEDNDRTYRNFAVKYKFQEDFKPSKGLEDLKQRLSSARKAHWELDRKYHFADHTSATIGCKNCGSSIATKYIKRRNTCPVCGADMRPKSTLDRLSSLKEKADKLQTACEEKERAERIKSLKHADEYWLIKYEYHV